MKTVRQVMIGVAAMLCLSIAAEAQSVDFKGIKNNMRYDDGEDTKTEYLGWDAATGTAKFSGDQGLWDFSWDGTEGSKVTTKLSYYENLMYGNSGAFYKNGTLYTVMSHQSPNNEEEMEFVVRSFNAETGEKLTERTFPKSANLESRGMCYNPKDGKVYGLFYFTDVALPVPEDSLDKEDIQEGYTTDAGYALATVDLETMALTQITPGVYYDNYVFLACNPEGRLFSMTTSGTLCEFDASTGLLVTVDAVDADGNIEKVSKYSNSGQETQFKRQAACFDYLTGKLYWNGYVNSGKGINDWGSWSTLSDKEWRTNGKYDTALYEIDINDGSVKRLGLIDKRMAYSCMWIPGHDATEVTGISHVNSDATTGNATTQIYNTSGQLIYKGDKAKANLHTGIYIVKEGKDTKKIAIK